ncbi:MAG: hypothetical protein BMS9Abin36_0002 [Gammaproteobacteria bacterium]|nr:MAG: hypothetical protein BMS9Abin36_0002 [Gammaproteobacteria bacterium]
MIRKYYIFNSNAFSKFVVLLLSLTSLMLSSNAFAESCEEAKTRWENNGGYSKSEIADFYSACKERTPMVIKRKDYNQWLENKAKHVILPNSYYCFKEETSRNVANYILSNGSVTKRDLENNDCYFVNLTFGAQIIKISSDKKIVKILTHKAIYTGSEPITMYHAYIPADYLQSLSEHRKQKF